MKNTLAYIAVAAVLVSSVVKTGIGDLWYSQFVFVLLFGFLFLSVEIFKLNIALGLFYTYIVLSTVFVARQDLTSIMCLIQMTGCLYGAKLISGLDYRPRINIFKIIFSLFILQCVWGIVQKLGVDPLFRLTINQALCDTVGFSGSHNQYGLFLAASAMSSFLFCKPALILGFFALVLSQTFSTYIGFAAGLGVLFSQDMRKKTTYLVLAFLILVVGGCGFLQILNKNVSGKLSERIKLWKHTIVQVNTGKALMNVEYSDNTKVTKVVVANPLTGFGFGQFMKISPYTQGDILKGQIHRYEHAHNDFIEVLFDIGYIGIALLIAVLVTLVIGFLYAAKTKMLLVSAASLMAYLGSSLGIYTVHTAAGGFYLAVYLGLFIGALSDGARPEQPWIA